MMSSKAEQIAATAESDIGKTRDDVDCSGTHDWCAQYVSRVLNRCDIPEYDTIVTYLLNKLLASGKWVEKTGSDPARGDVMAFDRNHIQEERPLDHILIVTGFDGTTITYVDGNGEGSQKVEERTIARNDPAVERWIRYTADTSFYPTTPCYDISFAQAPGGDILTCIDAIADTGGGGILLQVGGLRNSGFNPETDFNVAEAVARIKSHNMGLGVYFYNYGNYENDLTSVFQAALDYLQTIGCTKDDINMGVWIDTEHGQSWDPDPSSDKSVNYAYVERFMNLFDNAGYAVAGIYSSAANFEPWYGSERIGNRPIWAAYWTGTFDTVDRSTLDYFLPESSYTKVYIMQYSEIGRVPGYSGNLDCDKVLAPMPTNGGGGGGGTVSSVTVSIIAPKRIYFTPNPDVFLGENEFLTTEQEITISTDAENAELYYTVDGSSPYQYQRVVGNEQWQYILSSHAIKYTEPVTIKTDTHFRVIAVPTGTMSAIDPLLAKGSGTYLFNFVRTAYSWEDEQYTYRLESDNKQVRYFEENRQAFLRYHAEETAEEIIYNAVVAASEQATGTAQPESGEAEEGGHAGA